MRTLIFTGNGGEGISLAAAATASKAAQSGKRTLLVSIGPSHGLAALMNTTLGNKPEEVAPNLSAWAIDVLGDVSAFMEQLSAQTNNGGGPFKVSGDELPLIPGADLFIGLGRIRQETAAGYDVLVIDAGAHDGLLRALAVPDGFRWFVRLMFGLDRGPGRSSASMGRAVLPSTLLPFEWVGQVQEARVQLEQIRDEALDQRRTSVRYVLRPDTVALNEARLAIPGLYLHEMAVDALIVGPLLPSDLADPRVSSIIAHQQTVVDEATRIWRPLRLFRMPVTDGSGLTGLNMLGASLYNGSLPTEDYAVMPPIERGGGATPFIAINLPGLQREALGLTISGDELIVRAGPYRRHVLLHEPMRGIGPIKATREGDRLVVRPRG